MNPSEHAAALALWRTRLPGRLDEKKSPATGTRKALSSRNAFNAVRASLLAAGLALVLPSMAYMLGTAMDREAAFEQAKLAAHFARVEAERKAEEAPVWVENIRTLK